MWSKGMWSGSSDSDTVPCHDFPVSFRDSPYGNQGHLDINKYPKKGKNIFGIDFFLS